MTDDREPDPATNPPPPDPSPATDAAGDTDGTAATNATATAGTDAEGSTRAWTRTHTAGVVGAAAVAFALLVFAVVHASSSSTPVVAASPTAGPPTAAPRTEPPATDAPVTDPPVTDAPVTEPGVTPTTRKPRVARTGPPGPLTGAPVDRPGYEQRPAVVLKIDNYDPDARPQAGLTLADVVYEEMVEGSLTRFAAVFQGSDADKIGPIRSARSTDIAIAGPLHRPLFGYSGANGGFQQLLSVAPITDVGAGARPGSYYRGGDKVIPHNLYTSSALIYGGTRGYTPTPLWDFRGARDPVGAGARTAGSVTYQFGGNATVVSWAWSPDEHGWVRTQNGSVHYDQDNWPVTAENVLIQYVPYVNSIADDMFGNPIPEADLGGVGRGWLLTTDGAAVPLSWTRYATEEPTRYTDANGAPVRFAPGRTWVILVPMQLPATIRFTNGTAGG